MTWLCRHVPCSGVALAVCLASGWATPSLTRACGATPLSFNVPTDEGGGVAVGTRALRLYAYGLSATRDVQAIVLRASKAGAPAKDVPTTFRALSDFMIEVDLLRAAVEPDTDYELEVRFAYGDVGPNPQTKQLMFHGVDVGPPPRELGMLALRMRGGGRVTTGVCGDSIEGEIAVLELVPSAEARPWLRSLSHQLWVDGKPVFEPEMPLIDLVEFAYPTQVRIIAACARTPSSNDAPYARAPEVKIEPGIHQIEWRASGPGGETPHTDTLEVDLRCGASNSDAEDAGANASDAGAAVSADAGAPASGPLDGEPDPDDGCALGQPRGVKSASAWLLGLALALLVRRRRAPRVTQRAHQLGLPATKSS